MGLNRPIRGSHPIGKTTPDKHALVTLANDEPINVFLLHHFPSFFLYKSILYKYINNTLSTSSLLLTACVILIPTMGWGHQYAHLWNMDIQDYWPTSTTSSRKHTAL